MKLTTALLATTGSSILGAGYGAQKGIKTGAKVGSKVGFTAGLTLGVLGTSAVILGACKVNHMFKRKRLEY